MFPALIALVALIGLVGDPSSTTKTITQIVTKIGPSSAASTFAGPIRSITSRKSAAGIVGIIGLAAALWSASSYVGAFMRASNVIYETPEGRPIWKLRPLQVLVTLVMLVLLVLVALALVLTGPIVTAVAGPLGIGATAVEIWDIAKWPVLVIVVITMLALLFYAAPNVKLAGFRWVTPGALFAVVVWLVASPRSRSTWPTSAPMTRPTARWEASSCFWSGCGSPIPRLLLGMELNAERERSRELEAGIPGAERELQLDARSVPKRQKTT
jgi:membrane protein